MADAVFGGFVSRHYAGYILLARREEKQVIAQFGEEYRDYQQRVPMLFPRLGQWKQLVAHSSLVAKI